jgi:hypothetical protein
MISHGTPACGTPGFAGSAWTPDFDPGSQQRRTAVANGSKISAMWSQRNLGWQHAALLFGVCGAASSQLLNLNDWGVFLNDLGAYLLPIPFGIVAAWLLVEGIVPAIWLVVLDAAVWQAAYRLATRFADEGPIVQRVAAMYLAGLVGGLGVSLAAALCQRRAPSMRAVGLSALAGGVCGLPFAWWVISGNQAPIPDWAFSILCFAIWQAAVGVCLWRGFRLGKAGLAA